MHRSGTRPLSPWLAAAAGALLFGLPAACGGGDSDTAAGSSSGSSGAGAGGGLSSSGGGGSPITDACATATVEGEPISVTMLIMFDKSGSMLLDQKWAGAKTALTAFFQDEGSAGLSVGLRFFPDDEPVAGCNEIACDVGACAAPLVEAAPLSALPAYGDPQQVALVDAVASRSPGGETPMYAALAGAEQWAVAHAGPDGETVVVLVTDGEPNGCNEDPAAIAALAGDANSAAGVLTYAIGMQGALMSLLDLVATAGGTDKAFVVGGANVHKELRAALDEIRKSKIACVFPVPDSQQAGQEVNPGEVNVTFTPGGGEQQVLGQVSGPSDCGAGGWYYDDPAAPTTITLCPATCDMVQGDLDGRIEVVLGCKTVLK